MHWPSRYMLTKTHCGGYCIDCGPSTYQLFAAAFVQACQTARHLSAGGDLVNSLYSAPNKAIHLFRSPFDNILSRLHLIKRRKIGNKDGRKVAVSRQETDFWRSLQDTEQSVLDWCSHLQTTWENEEMRASGPVYDLHRDYSHVPCYAEWYRYIQWHNLAYQTTRQVLDMSVLYVHYEDYVDRFDETVEAINDYLQLATVRSAVQFESRVYRDIFSPTWVKQVAELVEHFAEPEVWELIRHYFEDAKYMPVYGESLTSSEGNQLVEYRTMDDAEKVATKVTESKEASTSQLPYIAWLLSFPNSVSWHAHGSFWRAVLC
jgi:hypothetical protein